MNAVASGVSNAALLSKLEDLEAQKMDLEQRILEQSSKKQQTVITEDALRQLLASFKDRVADRNIPEIKKFISSYVEKVIVYKEYVELILKVPVTALEEKQKPQPHAVVVSHGGGEGI